MNFRLIIQLYKNMGSRYFMYRVKHEIERKFGILLKKHPIELHFEKNISKDQWVKNFELLDYCGFNFSRRPDLSELKFKAEKILNGNLQFFNAEWIHLGSNYDWITNPINGFKYDISEHWSNISDLSEEAGDIKYVWEKSRFSWINTLIRYDYHYECDLSEFVFSEIESWIDHNPINRGPNWRCSQEISLRIFNWINVLNYYSTSKAFTDRRWNKIQEVIYASLHHVYHHIDFSRIAVRNNHAITETLFLALSNILFPFISETKQWSKEGREWFEEEISYQIYNDGTFLQFSHNYHRVVIQLLTLGISISERACQPFSSIVYERAYKSTEFLFQCLQEENGWLPNYGSNDGALFFPYSDTNYRDFRPQLNSIHYLLTGQLLYVDIKHSEEINWWKLKPSKYYEFEKIQKIIGIKHYPIGGYVVIREKGSFTFIRCGTHNDRPAQADNLHIDIWVAGINVFRDSGTYKYNTTPDFLNYFMGTRSHNTVSVDKQSQMLKGRRFIWYYWTQLISSKIRESENEYYFEGEISAYRHLNKKGRHRRIVRKTKHSNKWIIYDEIKNLIPYKKEQIWHYNDIAFSIKSNEEGENLLIKEVPSFNSDYYGVKEVGKAQSIEFKNSIETVIEIK